MEATTVRNEKYFFVDALEILPVSKIDEVFKNCIEPICGNQERALRKIKAAQDRRCYFLYDESMNPQGVLAYKSALTNKYERFGISDSLEIKTVFVIDGGESTATRLIKKLQKIARKSVAKSVFICGDKRSNFSADAFQRYDFAEMCSEKHLLKLSSLEEDFQRLALNEPIIEEHFGLTRINTVYNVHQDDIHGIIKLDDETFITGSKDGALIKWGFDGTLKKAISVPERINYRNWVTALTRLDERHWISGTRNGNAYLWDNAGNFIRDLNARHGPFQKSDLHCKQRNVHRINCLASFNSYIKGTFFVGWPSQFSEHTTWPARRVGYTYTHQSDWVYAIEPVSATTLLVITGCLLDFIKLSNDQKRWEREFTLVGENDGEGQRPFISAITALQDSSNLYGLAVFDGSVRVVDLESRNTIFKRIEHRNRVWTIENIGRSCFASSADDGFIKLWDIRQPKSFTTVRDNTKCRARVSILKYLKDHQLLSGSCPDNIKNAKYKAQFSFWDTRKMFSNE